MKREDRAKDPAPAGDFYRESNHATSDPLVEFLTEFAMHATAAEVERQLLAAYGPDRLPGTESRRRSNMGLGQLVLVRACAQCGELLAWTPRFCSQACWRSWHEEHPKPSLDRATLDEMQAALDELGRQIEDDE